MFKSEAQRERMKELVKQGKMSQAVYDTMEVGTAKEIPERIHPKKEKK